MAPNLFITRNSKACQKIFAATTTRKPKTMGGSFSCCLTQEEAEHHRFVRDAVEHAEYLLKRAKIESLELHQALYIATSACEVASDGTESETYHNLIRDRLQLHLYFKHHPNSKLIEIL